MSFHQGNLLTVNDINRYAFGYRGVRGAEFCLQGQINTIFTVVRDTI